MKKNIWAGGFMVDISSGGNVLVLYTIVKCGGFTIEMTFGASNGHINAYYTDYPGVTAGTGISMPDLIGVGELNAGS